MGMWTYMQTEPSLYTVGFYSQNGIWHPDSDWGSRDEARERVRYLNGGAQSQVLAVLKSARMAISTLDEDVFGYAKAEDGVSDEYAWPIRDELLANLDAAIKDAG